MLKFLGTTGWAKIDNALLTVYDKSYIGPAVEICELIFSQDPQMVAGNSLYNFCLLFMGLYASSLDFSISKTQKNSQIMLMRFLDTTQSSQ